MEPFATAALLVIGLIAYSNYAHGTLPQWWKSKFLNASDPQNIAQPGGAQTVTGSQGGGVGGVQLTRPVPGPITSPFGVPRSGHTHEGADLQAAEGDPIVAAANGVVSAQTTGGDCGNRIDINHDVVAGKLFATRYCHLSAFKVKAGDTVNAGQTIGLVGHTGDATGPHLHFEVRLNGVAVDPAPYIGG